MKSKNSSPPLNLSSHQLTTVTCCTPSILATLKGLLDSFFVLFWLIFFLLFFFRVVLRAREKGLGSNLQVASKALFTVNSNGN